MRPAIRVDNLSKKFRINRTRQRYGMLREALLDLAKAPLRHLRNGAALGDTQDFWALENVDFEVQPGEVVGLVGRNGAGKSTLLKVISRITAPTTGRVELHGRVGSLLEVGTGFHPELTGRENIFLNGSILGMTRTEIHRQFDEIVDFSGVEAFLDTPVKRYSSGMQVRLAFAVAAHLNPELLLVDEVLAVGDAAFQSKCLAKMGDVAHSGRTILFVSHNMAAVQNLCTRALMLEGGTVTMDDEPGPVIDAYLKGFAATLGRCDLSGTDVDRYGCGPARFESAEIRNLRGEPTSAIAMGEGIRIRLDITTDKDVPGATVSIHLTDGNGLPTCLLNSDETAAFETELPAGETTVVECTVPEMNLMPGQYRVSLELRKHAGRGGEVMDGVRQALSFDVVPRDVYNTGRVPGGSSVVFLRPQWCVADREYECVGMR